MADRTRSHPWDMGSLGGIETWSDLLLGSINLMLGCRFPCVIFWGPEMTQFYNDDYLPLMAEKHPAALGQGARECWKEAWHLIGPQFEAALLEGRTTFEEDVLVPVIRNGRLQDVYWTYSYSPIHESDGTISGIIIVCQDKTGEVLAARAHKLAEQQLARERKLLLDLVHQAPAFIAVLRGPTHTYEVVNARYEELVGARPLIGRTVSEALPEAEQQGFIALLDQVYQTGETYSANGAVFKVERTSGLPSEDRYLDYVYHPMREAGGEISGIIVLGIDATERRRAEQTLLKSERLAEVGRLASTIAHEINNPLEAVMNLLYLARGDRHLSAETAGYIDAAEQELRRVAVITNQTLSFHKSSAIFQPVHGHDMFAGVLSIYQGRIVSSNITVEGRRRATRPIFCFEGEIRQVLGNLIGNAIESMPPGGGRLLLRSREGKNWSTERDGLFLTVADSGAGIGDRHIKRIFEAFFTTKGEHGNGLGLWVSREIVERHQGSLRVRSRQQGRDHGTVFSLFLPFDAQAPQSRQSAPAA